MVLLFSKLGTPLLRTVCLSGLMADNNIWVSVFVTPPVPAERCDTCVLERRASARSVEHRRLATTRDGSVPFSFYIGHGDAAPEAWDCNHASASSSKRFPAPWVSSSSQPPPRLDVFAAARGRRVLVPSRGRRRLGWRLAFLAVLRD